MMTPKTREELLDLIPAYAIGALDDAERGELEIWLTQDPDAQALVASYQQVAHHLVAFAPLRPAPDHLRADLRRRLAAPVDAIPASPQAQRGVSRVQALIGQRARWALAAAALLVLAVVGVLVAQSVLIDDLYEESSAKSLYYQLKKQPGTSEFAADPGELDDAISGELVISADGTKAVLCIWDLPAIAEDQVLQMWLIDQGGARTSGGIYWAEEPGHNVYIQVPVEQVLSNYQAVGVSLEPDGGSPYIDQPSGPRVLSVRLS